MLYPRRGSCISNIPPRLPHFTKMPVDVTGGKVTALMEIVSGLSAVNPLVAFYNIHRRQSFFNL
jgi:hypothetical protein